MSQDQILNIILIAIGALNLILSGVWLGSITIDISADSVPNWTQYVWFLVCLGLGFYALHSAFMRILLGIY